VNADNIMKNQDSQVEEQINRVKATMTAQR
jgi:hypothetical protein